MIEGRAKALTTLEPERKQPATKSNQSVAIVRCADDWQSWQSEPMQRCTGRVWGGRGDMLLV
jgi:hypothetical protein